MPPLESPQIDAAMVAYHDALGVDTEGLQIVERLAELYQEGGSTVLFTALGYLVGYSNQSKPVRSAVLSAVEAAEDRIQRERPGLHLADMG